MRRFTIAIDKYVRQISDYTTGESRELVELVMTALIHELFSTGTVSTPLGQIHITSSLSTGNLKVKITTDAGLNTYLSGKHQEHKITEYLLPQHIENISLLQAKAKEVMVGKV